MELSDECRDCAKGQHGSGGDQRNGRYRFGINPEWFAHPTFGFDLLPVEVNMLFQTQTDKIEVFNIREARLFQEHNALIRGSRSRALFIETAYLFCMDAFASASSRMSPTRAPRAPGTPRSSPPWTDRPSASTGKRAAGGGIHPGGPGLQPSLTLSATNRAIQSKENTDRVCGTRDSDQSVWFICQ
uniref:Transposase n=1 Tax=Macrostomum lignano TaxID=282301 RepID=A0A1I8FIC0_9PLAT